MFGRLRWASGQLMEHSTALGSSLGTSLAHLGPDILQLWQLSVELPNSRILGIRPAISCLHSSSALPGFRCGLWKQSLKLVVAVSGYTQGRPRLRS